MMSKYRPQLTKEICKFLQQGNNRGDTCNLAGISSETFCQWMKNKPDFNEAVHKAEAKCKQRNIALIQTAAIKTWTAAAWWLERKHPDEFALRNKFEHTGAAGGPIVTKTLDLKGIDKETLQRLAYGPSGGE